MIINNIISRLFDNPWVEEEMDPSVFGQLVCLMGPQFEKDYLKYIHTILENREAITGVISFYDHLRSMYALTPSLCACVRVCHMLSSFSLPSLCDIQ